MSASVRRRRSRLQVRTVIQSMMICNKGVINLPKGPGLVSQCKMVQSTSINARNTTICLWSGLTRQVNITKRLLYQLERRYTLCDRVPNLCYEKYSATSVISGAKPLFWTWGALRNYHSRQLFNKRPCCLASCEISFPVLGNCAWLWPDFNSWLPKTT